MENVDKPKASISVEKVGFGLVLIAVGAVAFGASIDLWEFHRLIRLWPLILIAVGVASEVEALRNRRSDGGSSVLIGVGVWLLFGTLHLFDLSLRTAFPLGVIVVGLGTVVHALVDLPEPKEKKNHESQSV